MRIIYNYSKLIFIIILILIPSLEVIQLNIQLQDIEITRTIYKLFFLSGAGRGHMFQIIYFWLLPLYLLFIVSSDSCYDEVSRYKYALLSRIGRKKYIQEKLIFSFVISFVFICLSLLLNMIFVYIFFNNRCSNIYLSQEMIGMEGIIEYMSLNYPLLLYIIYIFISSLIAGLLGMLGAMISLILDNKKYVYTITFLIWLIFIISDDSIMLIFQPYIEYSFEYLIRILFKFVFFIFVVYLEVSIYEKKKSFD
jgi:hypothetical protein